MGMAAILVMWPGPYKLSFPLPKEAPHQIWLWSAGQFLRRRCLKMWMDDGRTHDRWTPKQGYTSRSSNGSGELIKTWVTNFYLVVKQVKVNPGLSFEQTRMGWIPIATCQVSTESAHWPGQSIFIGFLPHDGHLGKVTNILLRWPKWLNFFTSIPIHNSKFCFCHIRVRTRGGARDPKLEQFKQ